MPTAISFSRSAWVKLYRLQASVCLLRSITQKGGMASTAACECGAKEQTAEYVMTSFPIYHHPNAARALSDVEKNLATWIMSGHLVELPALVHLPQTKKKPTLRDNNQSYLLHQIS